MPFGNNLAGFRGLFFEYDEDLPAVRQAGFGQKGILGQPPRKIAKGRHKGGDVVTL